jgi:hypothetical protein
MRFFSLAPLASRGGNRLTLPPGDGPFPAVIGIGRGTGSLPANIFTDRNIGQIACNFGQVIAHAQRRGNEPINRLHPELTHLGAYSAWSWGVSRLIDGLELVPKDLPVDDAEFKMRNGLSTTGWQWITMEKYALEPGAHSVTFGFREDGFKLDKLCLSTFFLAPDAPGPAAVNACE